jgi:hypothetical protein
VRELSPFNFGLLVAYLVPGFVVLWGAGYHFEIVRGWLAVSPESAATVGDLLYATLASVAAGMIVSAFRWAIIDTIHSATGISQPPLDFSLLPGRLEAYQTLVEIHYRYYQFYANMLIALVFAYVARRAAIGGWADQWGPVDIGFVVVCVVLFFSSRDALRKYYRRAGALLQPQRKGVSTMTNGGDKGYHEEKKVVRKEPKAAGKPSGAAVKRPATGK